MPHKFSRLERILTGVVAVLSTLALTFLLQQSVFLTTQDTHCIDTGSTRGFYTADKAPWAHLAVFALLAALAWFLARRPGAQHARGWRAAGWLALAAGAVLGVLLCWLAVAYRMQPVDDGARVFEAAQQLLAGDTTELGPQGYLNLYPNLLFFTLYEMAFVAALGAGNALVALQVVNLLCWLLACWLFAKAAARLHAAPQRRGAYALVLLLWLPMGLYITFLYGTMPGLALSAVQVWAFTHLLPAGGQETPCVHPGRWALLTAAAGALAALFKQNYLILSVAVCLYLGWQALRAAAARQGRGAWLPLLAAMAAAVLLYAGGSAAVSSAMYASTGLVPGGGKPMSSWLAQGILDVDTTEGWYSMQEGTLIEPVYYTEGRAAMDAYYRGVIRDRLAAFRADPAMMLRFYARKTTSQWNMPTFQSLDTNRNRSPVPRAVRWGEELLAVGGRLDPLFFLAEDIVLTQLWAWALLGLLLRRRTLRPEDVFFYVVFLGGFVFHLFWEAKAQYTLVYAFLLLPCALDGWCAFGTWAARRPASKAAARTLWPAALAAAFMAMCGASGQYISCTRAEAQEASAAYAEWRAAQTPVLPEGPHAFYQAWTGLSFYIDKDDPNGHLITLPGQTTYYELHSLADRLLLDSVPNTAASQLLDTANGVQAIGATIVDGRMFPAPKKKIDPNDWTQQWYLTDVGDGLWSIGVRDEEENELVLTVNEEDGLLWLEPYRAEYTQMWRIAPKTS